MADATWGERYPQIQDDGDLKIHLSGSDTGVAVTTYPIDGQSWLIDGDSKAIVTVGWGHHLTHEGYMYSAMYLKTDIANDGKHLLHFKTGPGKRVHLEVLLASSTKAYATVYAGATMSANGTQITTGANNIGNTDHTPDLTIFHTPTVSVNGSVMGQVLLGSGNRTNPSGGTSRASGSEWELQQSTSYWVLFEAKGGAGVTTDIGVEVLFYHEP